MYKFSIKDNSPDINLVVTRSLLALAAIASLLYRSNQPYFINVAAAILLFIASVFINRFFAKFKFNSLLLLSSAAAILFIATHSILFAAILFLYGLLVKKISLNPVIIVNTEGVSITKILGNRLYSWNQFNNIVLKDNLLTLDFKNNKLLQLNIHEGESTVDEVSFNTFCSGFIGT